MSNRSRDLLRVRSGPSVTAMGFLLSQAPQPHKLVPRSPIMKANACFFLSLLFWLAAALPAAEPPKSKDPLGDLFNLGRSLIKTADDVGQEALGLTTEEENRVGRDVSEMIRRRHPAYTDRPSRSAFRNWTDRCWPRANGRASRSSSRWWTAW